MAEQTPQQRIAFNVKTAEKERTDEPFVVALEDGSTVTFNDPRDLDWQDVATLENPIDFVRLVVSDEDKVKLRKAKIPAWIFNQMISEFQIHYGIGTSGTPGAPRF